LSFAAVADALASRLSAAARKEAAAVRSSSSSSSSSDFSKILEEAAESCLELAREADAAGRGGEGEGDNSQKTTAVAALVTAFDLAVDAEAAAGYAAGLPKALELWREAAAALSSSASSVSGDGAAAAAGGRNEKKV